MFSHCATEWGKTVELSLIIPAHNEQLRLVPTLATYHRALQHRYNGAFEIIVVANACTDDTVRVAHEAASTLHHVRLIEIPEAVGKGGAVLAGFREARGWRVLFADADAASEPHSLIDLAGALERHDVVIGSRRLPTSTIARPQPLRRRLVGHAFALTVRMLYGMPYHDTQCGAKAFRRDAAQRLLGCVEESRWAFDVDLLLSARLLGLSVAEHPVIWSDQQGSQLRLMSTAGEIVPSLWRLKLRQVRAQRGRLPQYAEVRG